MQNTSNLCNFKFAVLQRRTNSHFAVHLRNDSNSVSSPLKRFVMWMPQCFLGSAAVEETVGTKFDEEDDALDSQNLHSLLC